MGASRRIVDVEQIPEGGNTLFRARREDELREVVLLDLDGDVVAYENYCQHWTDVKLDSGDGATIRNGEILCEKHGAYFEGDSGYCNYGPCEGAVLNDVAVEVREGTVYLADDGYEYVGLGPVDNGEMGLNSRIEFSG
jgi:nitrite reductase/ring-hydroxylating ferredoxin subunit